jgi:hypothetical protein
MSGWYRYNLTLPEGYLTRIEDIAKKEHTQTSDIIRRFVTIGLIAAETEKRGGNLVIRLGGKEDVLVAFPAIHLETMEAK